MDEQAPYKHLSAEERYEIQHHLDNQNSIRSIAKVLGRSPSTILREIKNHTKVYVARDNSCANKASCKKRYICGSRKCKKLCKNCINCRRYCSDYTEIKCETLLKSPFVCNGCNKFHYCKLKKYKYSAISANIQYRKTLVERRNGFDLTLDELENINNLASPLIMNGHSPYHIKQVLGDTLPISESTLRRLIYNNELDARNIDLRNQVKRKVREKRTNSTDSIKISKLKEGPLYKDYLKFIDENDVMTVQMDCVEGKKEDSAVLLTLHFPLFHMQLAFILDNHTSSDVVATLDKIESVIGSEMFKCIFEVIITDNGHEFTDIQKMERSINGGQRTKIFFCEPNRSDEKAACENNHRLIRYIIPKGKSLEPYMQSDISLMMNHINSYKRKSLCNKSPYEIAKGILPEDLFILLGLEEIPPEEILLKPSLIKRHISE